MAVKWHVNGEKKPGKCSARKGQCLFGADAPHYGSKREAQAAAEELIARESAGFGGGVAGLREAFGGVDGLRVDAAGRFYWCDGEAAECVSGADVARWDGGGDSMVDIIDGGGEYALNADGGHARVLSGVNGGVVGGRFRGVSVCGCRLDEVTGDARLNDVGDYRREDASAPVSRINVMSGNARVLRLAAGCHVGSVTGRSKVMKVNGGVGVVSGSGVVASVLAGGRVGAVVDDGSVSHVEGADGAVATVGVVDADSRVGVLGEYARVGFAVNADSVSDSKDAARLLDARLRRESSDGYGGGGLRVSEGVRRSLYSGEGVSVALSVVARDGSSVVLDEDDVRRVLRGRPVASEWDVDAVFRSFESSLDRRAGEWAAGAGDVVLPPSGWDDWMEPVVGDDDE